MVTHSESIAWCVFYASGIIGALLCYGVIQERIMSMPYGEPPLRFQDSIFLVFLNRAVAVLFAMAMVFGKGESWRNAAPLWKYLAISFSNVYASSCQYEALKYVSFPVQMLGKSFKMAPVMLWGIAVSGKQYKLADWLVAAAVTGGITEFLMTGPITGKADSENSAWGLGLLVVFLLLDGFTSTFQEKLFKEHSTTKYNQMLYVNLGSCLISSVTVIASGRLGSAVNFLLTQPAFALDASLLSASAIGGQWFIYSQVKEFGALVFAATMNVRQVVSILLSYHHFGHSITALQVLGLVIVFAGLFYKSLAALLVPKDNEHEALLNKDKIMTAKEIYRQSITGEQCSQRNHTDQLAQKSKDDLA
jgi:adenosine 3'-phospho 5'-phosphosulfate transporter B2